MCPDSGGRKGQMLVVTRQVHSSEERRREERRSYSDYDNNGDDPVRQSVVDMQYT
jgi:hypothetical protein